VKIFVWLSLAQKFETLSTGFVICNEEAPINPVSQYEAQIYILSLLEHKPIFSKGYEAVMHCHTAVEECTVSKIISGLDKSGKPTGKKLQFIPEQGSAIVRFKTAQHVCVETFDAFPQLGRFTLRDEGKTIAIGKIIRLPAKKRKQNK